MKVRALAILNTPDGTKEVGDQFDMPAAQVEELVELKWVEKVDAKAKTDAAEAKA